ncbi:hypothetical protein RRG08_015405 [Elysia crispata]|uniref:Uncharacterized protein n=1 Tax=Elysia crispata TaxID=231223 RepID=A0AAE1E5M0_9GAST|nr:hypothetical protein RRG08_015405 [Elysia crispata]
METRAHLKEEADKEARPSRNQIFLGWATREIGLKTRLDMLREVLALGDENRSPGSAGLFSTLTHDVFSPCLIMSLDNISFSLTLLAFSFYSYKSWTHGLLLYTDSSVLCTVIVPNEAAMRALTFLDHVMFLYLPSLAFLFFDLGLLCCVCFHKRCLCRQKATDDVYWRRRVEVLNMVVFNTVLYQALVLPKAVSMCHAWLQGRWALVNREAADEVVISRLLQLTFYLFFVISPTAPFFISRKFRRSAFLLISSGCSKSISNMTAIRPASHL